MSQPIEDINNSISPQIKAQFSSFIEPFFSQYHRDRCYPGLIFQQGSGQCCKLMYLQVTFLVFSKLNHPLGMILILVKIAQRLKVMLMKLKKYIVDRSRKEKPWIVGTLTANVAPKDITILELGRGICLVVIRRGVKLDITDGQHRKRAIHELIESTESHLISNDDFAITLVLEGDFQQCQADFRDMAQTKQLDKSLLLSFGEFSGRVGITKELIKRVPMFQGKTEKIKSSPATKQKLIYTTNFIARFVSCIFTNDPGNQLRDYDVYQASDALVICLNRFFSECSNTEYIADTTVEELTTDEVAVFKEDCILGISVGIEVLGRLLHYIYDPENNYFNEEKISQLAQLDWSRENQLWKDNVIRIDAQPKNPDKPYRISATVSAVTDAVKTVKITLGWM